MLRVDFLKTGEWSEEKRLAFLNRLESLLIEFQVDFVTAYWGIPEPCKRCGSPTESVRVNSPPYKPTLEKVYEEISTDDPRLQVDSEEEPMDDEVPEPSPKEVAEEIASETTDALAALGRVVGRFSDGTINMVVEDDE